MDDGKIDVQTNKVQLKGGKLNFETNLNNGKYNFNISWDSISNLFYLNIKVDLKEWTIKVEAGVMTKIDDETFIALNKSENHTRSTYGMDSQVDGELILTFIQPKMI